MSDTFSMLLLSKQTPPIGNDSILNSLLNISYFSPAFLNKFLIAQSPFLSGSCFFFLLFYNTSQSLAKTIKYD
jgi:hypothetical protein